MGAGVFRGFGSAGAVAALLAAAIALPAASAADGQQARQASADPVVPDGRPVQSESAKVLDIIDGDTIVARIQGDTRKKRIIRTAGMQTMEDGECGFHEASDLMTRLVDRRPIVLKSLDRIARVNPNSGYRRLLRNVFLTSGMDVQAEILKSGLALPYSLSREIINEDLYSALAQTAAASGQGLFSGTFCAPGPSQESPLQLMINYNGSGAEWAAPGNKFIRIRNLSDLAVPVGGWRLRAAAHDSYHFPAAAVVPAQGEVIVRLGAGIDTPTEFHWPGNKVRFPIPGKSKYAGGGGYLFDPDGDIRAWSIYPCRVACTHPGMGNENWTIDVVWNPPGRPDDPNEETVTFSNVSGARVDLSYVVAEIQDHVYEFPNGTFVDPGESLVLRMGVGVSDRLTHHLMAPDPVLTRPGGAKHPIRLRTHTGVLIACQEYGAVPRCQVGTAQS